MPHPPNLYRGVKVNSNSNGKIEEDTKCHPTKNRHVYKKYIRLVPTSNGGRRFLVAGDRGFEGSARRSRPSPARGYCWGSLSRMPEVARNHRVGAEGTEGHRRPGGYLFGRRSEDLPEGFRKKPKVAESPKVILSPEGHRKLPKV